MAISNSKLLVYRISTNLDVSPSNGTAGCTEYHVVMEVAAMPRGASAEVHPIYGCKGARKGGHHTACAEGKDLQIGTNRIAVSW